MVNLKTPLTNISGIGPSYSKKLNDLGLITVQDLMFYFPRKWNDFSNIKKISEIKTGEVVSAKGVVTQLHKKPGFRGRKSVITAMLSDNSGLIKLVWFNQPWISDKVKNSDTIVVSGKMEFNNGMPQITNPVWEYAQQDIGKREVGNIHAGRIVPIYSETKGLTSRFLRTKIAELIDCKKEIKDFLPENIKKQEELMSLGEAILQIHFPKSMAHLKKAKERLAFDELFKIQLNKEFVKKGWENENGVVIKFDVNVAKKFVKSLPFVLTHSQKKSAWEILQDLEKKSPANRLLEGEVGSGKTVVAALVVLMAQNAKVQSAILAPTEILASQHFHKVQKYFKDFKINVGLLTSKQCKTSNTEKITKFEFLEQLKTGKLDLIIGTHALLTDKINFKNLGLVIIDEQHRFGVEQRKILKTKNENGVPNLVSMTATPIPRTLALSLFGDLDLSIIDELPIGRKPVKTQVVHASARQSAYNFVKKELKNGRQCFVVCPVIDEQRAEGGELSENVGKLGLRAENSSEDPTSLKFRGAFHFGENEKKAVETESVKLSKLFPEFKVEMLHGKMKQDKKEKIMADFVKNRIQILVATSVVEVGVDIPNASVMIIEGAENFGLSQLHQFRGRVGRGEHESFCFLFSSSYSTKNNARLKALVSSNDGFYLAQKDLEIRGPGEMYGTIQHGIPDLKMASLTDAKMIERAKKAAWQILKASPDLSKYPELKIMIKDEKVYLE